MVHIRLHVVTFVIYVSVSDSHQSLYSAVEDTGAKCLWPVGDNLLHVAVCCKALVGQVLHKGSREMEITGREISTVRRADHNLPAFAP